MSLEKERRIGRNETATGEPLLSVDDVLREARDIVTGNALKKGQNKEENVLEESTTVQYVQPSSTRKSRPLEVIVRHSEIVCEPNSDEEDVDADTDGAPNSFCPASQDVGNYVDNKELSTRRWSESVNEKMSQEEDVDGQHLHHRVRYRFRHHSDRFDVTQQTDGRPDIDDDHDELQVEMDEEEIVCFPGLESAKKGTRTIVKRFWEARWKAQHFDFLPDWLQDNEFLRTGHRPPLPSFGACFKSIFSLHTETGNIWSHMFGCALFIGIAGWFLTRPVTEVQYQEKLVFSFFFAGAIACLGMSFAFHTVSCHSANVVKLFSKFDYVGISLLIVGSFIPWLFYGFYCRLEPKITYIAMVCVLGLTSVIVSLWDKFGQSQYRPLRAGLFVAMGLSGVVPAVHFMITDGLRSLVNEVSFHWLVLMALLYLVGAALYATRTPERFFPGKCDLWFQSHQLFHLCVVVAAFVHYHGISEMAMKRLQGGSCAEQNAIFT